MKTFKLTTACAIALVLATAACKKDKSTPANADATAKEFVNAKGPQTQKLVVNASELPQTIVLKGGTKITFPVGSLTVGGVPLNGTVDIQAIEVLKRSDVLLYGSNTNHATGAPLASDGFIYINATANGVKVDYRLNTPIQISIPAQRSGATQIWSGRDQNGAPLEAGNGNQMAWGAPRLFNGGSQDIQPVNHFYNFDFGSMGWINTDVFLSYDNPKTTVYVDLKNNPGALSSFHSFNGETYVFFCAKGSNVCAQLYTTNGTNGVKSYDNVMPVGVAGKMISFSIKDGKYFYAEQETTIAPDLHLTLNLQETTEEAVQAAINNLDNY